MTDENRSSHPQKRVLRVIVASPGDVKPERDAVEEVVTELNRGIAADRGLILELGRWETDAFPGFHVDGPQALIDSVLRIEYSDVFIGIFWKRFGTPTKDAQSGTEHEFRLACETWKQHARPRIMVYFNQKAGSPKSKEETEQWGKVIDFQKTFPKEGLWWAYKGKPQFEKLVRGHLTKFILESFPGPASKSPSAAPCIHQIPLPPADFVGRIEELARLQAAAEHGVLISGARRKCVAGLGLHGMAGVGKTALALKLAESLKAKYPDAQFYLDLKGVSPEPLTPADAMAHVLHGYRPEAKLPEKETELRDLYRFVLHGQRALLLLDNARDRQQIEPLIPPASCLLLVTSRRHFVLPGLHAEDLDALSAPDARALLLEIAPRIREQADDLARVCGCLPLALRLTAKALAQREDLAVPELLRRLDDIQQLRRPTSVAATLQTSYDLLSPNQQRLWRALAVFPGDFDLAAAAAVGAPGPDPAQDAVSELLAFGLLNFTPPPQPEEAGGRYRLHNLGRDFAASRLAGTERAAAQRRHAAHFYSVLCAADSLYKNGADWVARSVALFDLERSSIEAGQAWAAAHAAEDPQAAELADNYPDAGTYVISLRLHPRDQIRWREAALAAARWRKDRCREGVHLGNLGSVYADRGETQKAIECHEQSLAIARETGERRAEGNALGNLGVAYAKLGETRKAIELYGLHLVIAREIGDRHGEGNALGNLGLAYADLGEPRKAIECHDMNLTIAREIGDRRGEGAAIGNLGTAYQRLGETREAIECFEKAIAIAREIGDRRCQEVNLGNLGSAYQRLGEIPEAIERFEQALAMAREIGDRQGEGIALGNLGNAYADRGETRKAIELYEPRLAIAREIGDRQGEAKVSWNLGMAYEKQGDLRRAIDLMLVCVHYERELGHTEAEKHAAQVEALRERMGKKKNP